MSTIKPSFYLPKLALWHTLRVALGKLALGLHGRDGSTELCHGVELGGKAVHHLHHMLGKACTAGQVFGDSTHLKEKKGGGFQRALFKATSAWIEYGHQENFASYLCFCGDLASHEQVKDALWQGLLPSLSLGQQFLALWDAVATEPDALLWVQQGGLCHQATDATHTSIHLVPYNKL